jgi:hypothetical protein
LSDKPARALVEQAGGHRAQYFRSAITWRF